MTMVPHQNLRKQQEEHFHPPFCGGYDGCGDSMSRLEGYEYCISETCLGSDIEPDNNKLMAEDESRTDSLDNEAGSSSKNVQEERDEEWLRLSLGGHAIGTNHESTYDHQHVQDPTSRRGAGLVELDLLPGKSSSSHQARPLVAPIFRVPEYRAPASTVDIMTGASSFSTSLLFQQHHASSSSYPHRHQQEISWAFRTTAPQNIGTASSSPSTSSLMPLHGSYFSRPFQVHTGQMDAVGPSLDFRVIDPPRRPHSGVWFMLKASENQAKEPFLPQISKSYLRIKDGRMTVRLLMKYLVNKLKLNSESEIEIICRGQHLLPFLTLQHVRDSIWSPRDEALTLLPDSTTTDHVMVLHYARSA